MEARQGASIEIERRFLVKRIPEDIEKYRHSELASGFFIMRDDEYYRIRHSGDEYSLTYKSGFGLIRKEIEIPITREFFDILWESVKPEFKSEKARYYIPYESHIIELSIYHGSLNGYVNAEVELKHEDEKVRLPDWIGPEITTNRILTHNLGKPPETVLEEARRLLRESN